LSYWHQLEKVADVFSHYGREIRVPVVEKTELFARASVPQPMVEKKC
jgi:histidyl-tRNA synthetase